MSIVTHGLGDTSGLMVTQGLGSLTSVPFALPIRGKISRDIQHLINQMNQLTKCKKTTSVLSGNLVVRNVELDDVQDDMSGLHARLRRGEEQLRIFARVQRAAAGPETPVPEPFPTPPVSKLSPDIQHLGDQMRQLVKCKQTSTVLDTKLALRYTELDTFDSSMTDLHARLRKVEEQMRIFARLRRVTP